MPEEESQMGDMTAEQMGYMAGVLDGEGWVGIWKQGNAYHAGVEITQTNKAWLQQLQRVWGGKIKGDNTSKGVNLALKWKLYFQGHDVVGFLELVKDSLKLKREQASIVLELQKRVDQGGPGRRLLPQEIHCREKLYTQCRLLNKRGPRNDQLRLSEVSV